MSRYKIPLNILSLLVVVGLGVDRVDAQTNGQTARPGLPANNKRIDTAQLLNPVENIDIGYIKIPASRISGSVSTLRNDNSARNVAAISTNILLQSQLPGVKSINSSNTGAYVTIRGNATLNGSNVPLYIVDGIPVLSNRFGKPLGRNVDNDPISDINPEDIEKITVLKDAQATAIYGMRGANGVVLINTISGTSGKTYLDFSTYAGTISQPEELYVLNADQYRDYILAKEKASGVSAAGIANGVGRYVLVSTPAGQVERYNNNTNWQDLVLKNGMTSNYHLALRGGDAVAKYSLSLGYAKAKGVLEKTDFSRINIRFNLDYKVGKKLSFLNSLVYAKTNRGLTDAGNANTNPLLLSTLKAPSLAVYQQDTKGFNSVYLDSSDYNGQANPFAIGSRMVNKNVSNHISAKVQGLYTFTPDLVLRAAMYLDYFRLYEDRFQPSTGFAPTGYLIRYAAVQSNFQLMFLNENTLTYTKKSKSGAHQFTGLIGTAIQTTNSESKYGRGFNPLSDIQTNVNTNNPLYLDSIGSTSPTWKLASLFGTANYSYKDKYIFAGSLRGDGSDRFDEKKWGYFPSVSAAWRLSKEAMLKNNKTISELKLRASYGITGNEYVGVNNAYNALVSTPYIYSAISIGILGNPKFQWESTKQFNAGFDLELFKGRLALNMDIYNKKTDKLYNIIGLPTTSGFRNYAVSEGSVTNKGIETALSWKILNNPRKFSWQTSLNLTYNKNKITSLPARLDTAASYGDYTVALQTGTAIGSFFGYNALGVYKNTTDVRLKNGPDNTNPFKGGDIIFEDINNDGIIDFHDKKVIGNVNPDLFGGFINTFSYKNFDLMVFLDFASGGKIYNGRRAALESMSNNFNQSTTVLGAWKNEGDVTAMPRYLNGDPVGNTRFSSRWIEDGSYMRFKAVTLGYNFPMKHTFTKIFTNARVLVTTRNLATFSKYKGYSPEVGNFSNPMSYGVDYGNVPPLKSIIVGIQLGL